MIQTNRPARASTSKKVFVGALVVIALALLWRFDRDIFHAVWVGADFKERIEKKDWYQFFRAAGYLPTWLAIGGALLLHERPWRPGARRATWAGLRVLAAAAIAGGLAEALKPIVGRLRPSQTDGVNRFHGLPDDPTVNASFGMASSHAGVAFGAAFVLVILYPRAGIVAIIVACGCAWTRLLSGAHFASDVFVGALLGYACARLLTLGARR